MERDTSYQNRSFYTNLVDLNFEFYLDVFFRQKPQLVTIKITKLQ